MASNKQSKGTVAALATQIIAGMTKHLSGTTQIVLGGSSFTPAQVTSKLQAIVTLRSDVDAAKASTQAKLATEKAEMPSLHTFMGTLVTFIKATYANQPDVLADFGIKPKARTPLSAEAKTAAAAKRTATRAARHTMGAKQKKSVKGAVVGITVTPVSATASQPPGMASSPTAPAQSTGPTTASSPTAPVTSTGPTTATTPH
jgi:hypothetical protein